MKASTQAIVLSWNLVAMIALIGMFCSSPIPSMQCGAGELQVYPTQISVSTNYPARYAVFELDDKHAAMECTLESGLQVSIENSNVATIGTSLTVDAVNIGDTFLIVKHGSDSVRVPIQVVADEPIRFDRDVSAALSKSGCNLGTCHGNLFGKGGFRLSLRGDDPRFDFERIVHELGGRRIDIFEPKTSLILQKATTTIAHQGGKRFDLNSNAHQVLNQWITDGAEWTDSSPLTAIEVQPSKLHHRPGQLTSKLVVQATFADGSVRDVTQWARIEPSLPMGVDVKQDGSVRVVKPMDVSFSVSYLNGRSASRLVFLGSGSSHESSNDGFAETNAIDAFVDAQCEELRLPIYPSSDAATLVRRIYLVVVGRLPTADEVREFLAAEVTHRTSDLVDRLLADPGFDFAWAMRWSDLLRNEDKVMSPAGAAKLHDWLRQQISADRPINEWVAEMVSSIGSTYENPPASFHRTHRDPMTTAESVGQVFLGIRIQCAKCHNHPFDVWKQDDYYGLAAYFTTIDRKQIDNKPKDELDKHIITGDEIISLSDRKPEIRHPGRSKMVIPRSLRFGSKSLGSPNVEAEPNLNGHNVLSEFAQRLTRDNDQFDVNMANRIWSQYFGRGIVDPPDDFRDSNPPTNPELLRFLAQELKRSNYSIKAMTRLILTSQTFARCSVPEFGSESELAASPYFAGYSVRRMPAETLIDAVCDVTGIASEYRSGRDEEPVVAQKAMMMPGIPKRPGFLTTFGKPNRLLDCECERSNQVTLGQSLALINGLEIREKLVKSGGRIDQLIAAFESNKEVVEELFLCSISRYPSETERESIERYLDRSPGTERRRLLEDLMWSLLNSKEFMMLR